jgi:hypothetical protein
MTGSVEKMLLGFARGLRSRRRRLAVLVVAGWVLAAQTLLVVHGIEHDTAGGVACALCAAAHHQAVTPAVPTHAAEHSPPDRVESVVGISRDVLRAVAYHSRAPPVNLDS